MGLEKRGIRSRAMFVDGRGSLRDEGQGYRKKGNVCGWKRGPQE